MGPFENAGDSFSVFLKGSAFTSPFCCRFSWVGRASRLASVLEGGGPGGVEGRGGGSNPRPSFFSVSLSLRGRGGLYGQRTMELDLLRDMARSSEEPLIYLGGPL